MGSATYYLKASGCTGEKFKKVKAFIEEGCKAEDWWQAYRDCEHKKGGRDDFWNHFDKKFPMISKYLKSIDLYGGDCNNELAGRMDFGSCGNAKDTQWIIDNHLSLEDDEIKYYASCWHFASWAGFAKFLESEFDLNNTRWISEEDINAFDLL